MRSGAALKTLALQPIAWTIAPGLVSYPDALASMRERVEAILAGSASEWVWLLEHPPLYTAGSSAKPDELVDPERFPVHIAGRGGRYTYHGPGQRVGYVMLDLARRGLGVRGFIDALEGVLIDALAELGVAASRRDGLVGVWIDGAGGPKKIAAIGVRLRRWVSSHGFSLNVAPDLAHFSGIVPCGNRQDGVTSLAELGVRAAQVDVDRALRQAFCRRFGHVRELGSPEAGVAQAPSCTRPKPAV
jgi:lipoyl(octanoyl) transferase